MKLFIKLFATLALCLFIHTPSSYSQEIKRRNQIEVEPDSNFDDINSINLCVKKKKKKKKKYKFTSEDIKRASQMRVSARFKKNRIKPKKCKKEVTTKKLCKDNALELLNKSKKKKK